MRALLAGLLFAVLSMSGAEAFQRNSGGLSFDCSAGDAADGQCVCQPPASSTDCKNMKKYCEGDVTCGWVTTYCSCKQKPVFRNSAIQQGRAIKGAVSDRVRDPGSKPKPKVKDALTPTGGLLETAPGGGQQGPGGLGTGSGGGGRSAPVQLR